MTTTDPSVHIQLHAPIGHIDVQEGFNTRLTVDPDLKASIEALGVVTPLVVVRDGARFRLIAGHRRLAAAKAAGLESVPVVVREADTADVDHAVENLTRKGLSPLEEAHAIQRVTARGYTVEGAAEILDLSTAVVHSRLRLLELPVAVQRHFGPDGEFGPGMIDELHGLHVQAGRPEIVEKVADALVSDPRADVGWAIAQLIRAGELKDVWSARSAFQVRDTDWDQADIKLGSKKHLDMVDELSQAASRQQGYTSQYGPRLSGEDLDAARSYGCVIETAMHTFITDRAWLKDRLKQVIERDHADLKAAKETKKAARQAKADAELSPADREAKERAREFRALQREWKVQGRGANLDLGAALMNGIARVDVDMDVARFFCFGLLGRPGAFREDGKIQSGYGSSTLAELATAGARLCLEQLQDEEPPAKEGRPPKVTYATAKDSEAWAWRFLDGAKSPEELFGRTLLLYAAARYSIKHTVNKSERAFDLTPSSRKDAASKALDRLAKKHLPQSVKQLRRAIVAAYEQYDPPAPTTI